VVAMKHSGRGIAGATSTLSLRKISWSRHRDCVSATRY